LDPDGSDYSATLAERSFLRKKQASNRKPAKRDGDSGELPHYFEMQHRCRAMNTIFPGQ